ncbi:DUF3492 domain-containing protein [Streptomyces albus]|uniref:D-inositol 3-phosphate glycosyltransferase n=3 Tax=Streptomyces albus TaxID=1888 RepID=A0A8H1L4C8_9ACTN|nr:DUF3492 domain-containing protein [Streptomyces albus]TGG75484.1 DUF3492 domain-containing protein [Streptomyces albus]UVN54928.1 DUF3492 domain-containing protein [Streptomyces albus]
MRIALLTEGGYPYLRGESALWCDRLLRGLPGHEFTVHALSRSARQEQSGWWQLPPNVLRVRTAPLWGPGPGTGTGGYGRRDRRRFAEHFAALATALCTPDTAPAAPGTVRGTPAPPRTACPPPPHGDGAHPAVRGADRLYAVGGHRSAEPDGRFRDGGGDGRSTSQADRFAAGLYGLAELAAERGGLATALRSEQAVRILESACRAPGALRAAHAVQVPDLLAVTERLERALRPLSLDWYAPSDRKGGAGRAGREGGLAAADLCHAVGAGPAALPGLLAAHFFGVPLLLTEYGVRLREHYLAGAAPGAGAVARGVSGAPVRALLGSFQRLLAREAYTRAQLITPGDGHARRWQERCGAPRDRLRTVHPGMDPAPFDAVGEPASRLLPQEGPHPPGPPTLLWAAGRISPRKDLRTLLHAFARVRETVPGARLRIVETGTREDDDGGPENGGQDEQHEEHSALCRALAARLCPPGGDGRAAVTFEQVGTPAGPALADAYADADVVVLSSTVEGFPSALVEAMFCGRAVVSTDAGAVREVVGGTGLIVPAGEPRALAQACTALLGDPARAARLGAAARARALELFTVRQNVEAFRGIYLELISRHPAGATGPGAGSGSGEEPPRPFARPAEARLPGHWAGAARRAATPPEGRHPAARPVRRRSGSDGHGPAHVPSWAARTVLDGPGKSPPPRRTAPDSGTPSERGPATTGQRPGTRTDTARADAGPPGTACSTAHRTEAARADVRPADAAWTTALRAGAAQAGEEPADVRSDGVRAARALPVEQGEATA